jgi:hypothetical protein
VRKIGSLLNEYPYSDLSREGCEWVFFGNKLALIREGIEGIDSS